MGFDEDIRRKLRRLSEELEHGSAGMPSGRPPVRLRRGAAGLGMAVCIAASVALFAQLLPSKDEKTARTAGPASGGSPSGEPSESPTPEPSATYASAIPPASPAGAAPTPETPPPTPTPTPTAAPSADCPEMPPPAPPPDGISVTLYLSTTQAQAPTVVKMSASFKNQRSNPASYEQGNPKADFVVFDDSGTPVWVASEGKVFTQELRTGTYAPGEQDSYEATWNLDGCAGAAGEARPLQAGRYTVRAVWTGSLGGWSDPVDFQIT